MILLTGGTGLLGAHLLFDLVSNGKKVRALKRSDTNLYITKKIFSYYTNHPGEFFNKIEWVEGDILDIHALDMAFKDISDVYHCAGYVSFDPRDQKKLLQINADGTANIVNMSLEHNIRKLCYASSVAALGRSENKGIVNEESFWKSYSNKSPYAISKYEGEREVWRGIVEGLNAVIVNPTIIIGPGDWTKGSSKLFTSVGKGLKYFTSGVNGFVYVRDVAQIMMELMSTEINSERFVLNASSIAYKDMFELIARELNVEPPKYKANRFLSEIAWRIEKVKGLLTNTRPLITRDTARTANSKYFFLNKKVKEMLDYEFITLEDSVKDTAKHFLNDRNI